jgi:O-acetyl-ADP-ribose deacetylase (regulator of RNase III)
VCDSDDHWSDHVIHTVGSIWSDQTHDDHAGLLASCYRESLDLARQNACRSVAFPAIATGAYGFPIDLASEIAVTTVREWVDTNPGDLGRVVFVCLSSTDLAMYEGVLGAGPSIDHSDSGWLRSALKQIVDGTDTVKHLLFESHAP